MSWGPFGQKGKCEQRYRVKRALRYTVLHQKWNKLFSLLYLLYCLNDFKLFSRNQEIHRDPSLPPQPSLHLQCISTFVFLLHFRFWGTCEEHARLLHRYTCGSVIHCLPPLHLYWHFSPCYLSPTPHPCCLSPIPPNKPQCVGLPSLCPCVLIVQHPPMSDNMWYFIFCSCVSLLRMMFSRFIHVPTKDTNSLFLIAA